VFVMNCKVSPNNRMQPDFGCWTRNRMTKQRSLAGVLAAPWWLITVGMLVRNTQMSHFRGKSNEALETIRARS
jgi:hypothetical protein